MVDLPPGIAPGATSSRADASGDRETSGSADAAASLGARSPAAAWIETAAANRAGASSLGARNSHGAGVPCCFVGTRTSAPPGGLAAASS
jgi:hypothetical protein